MALNMTNQGGGGGGKGGYRTIEPGEYLAEIEDAKEEKSQHGDDMLRVTFWLDVDGSDQKFTTVVPSRHQEKWGSFCKAVLEPGDDPSHMNARDLRGRKLYVTAKEERRGDRSYINGVKYRPFNPSRERNSPQPPRNEERRERDPDRDRGRRDDPRREQDSRYQRSGQPPRCDYESDRQRPSEDRGGEDGRGDRTYGDMPF